MLKNRIVALIWLLFSVLIFIMTDNGAGVILLVFSILILFICFAISRLSGKKINYTIHGKEISPNEGNNYNGKDGYKNDSKNYDKSDHSFCIEFIRQNNSFFPVFSVCLDFTIKNITTGSIIQERNFKPNESNLVSSHCGYIEIKLERIIVYDFLNIFKRIINKETLYSFVIPPNIKEIEIDLEMLDSYDIESYEFSYSQKGDDPSETFSLKEYAQGDKMKSIHWKMSSKLDEIIIKEPSFPIDNNTMIILDNCMEEGNELDADQRNNLTELFISLSKSLVDKGIKHSIGWYDHKHHNFVFASVDDLDDLWTSIHSILKGGYEVDSYSVAYHFMEQTDDMHYANYMIVTENKEKDIGRLEDLGAVSIFTSEEYK